MANISKSEKYTTFFKTGNFAKKVVAVINSFDNKNNLTAVSNSTKIDFNSLKNMINVNDFETAVSHAHLGAHKSTSYISEYDIKNLAKKAGMFIVLTNEMLTNDSIQIVDER